MTIKKIILGMSLFLLKDVLMEASLDKNNDMVAFISDNNQGSAHKKLTDEQKHQQITQASLNQLRTKGFCRNGDFTKHNFYNIVRGDSIAGLYYRNEEFNNTIDQLNEDNTTISLFGSVMSGMDLTGMNFSRVNLSHTSMFGSRLVGARLSNTQMRSARLFKSDLTNAKLIGANLTKASLLYANLQNACLYGANLQEADLRHANLTNADLSNANLTNADLSGACLTGAILTGVILNEGIKNQLKCPLDNEMYTVHGTNFTHSNITLAQRASLNLK